METFFIATSLLISLLSPNMTKIEAVVTGYTSLPHLTDSEPFIMANGERVFFGALACPARFPFGTIIKGLGVDMICADRMNARYRELNHFDIYFETLAEAKKFGRMKVDLYVDNKYFGI